jgi:hypothetical protein
MPIEYRIEGIAPRESHGDDHPSFTPKARELPLTKILDN